MSAVTDDFRWQAFRKWSDHEGSNFTSGLIHWLCDLMALGGDGNRNWSQEMGVVPGEMILETLAMSSPFLSGCFYFSWFLAVVRCVSFLWGNPSQWNSTFPQVHSSGSSPLCTKISVLVCQNKPCLFPDFFRYFVMVIGHYLTTVNKFVYNSKKLSTNFWIWFHVHLTLVSHCVNVSRIKMEITLFQMSLQDEAIYYYQRTDLNNGKTDSNFCLILLLYL